jgi:GntR family transcriptional repressor for pyruvate dehydrogenase complex
MSDMSGGGDPSWRIDRSAMTIGEISLDRPSTRPMKAAEVVAQAIVHDIVRRGLLTGAHLPAETAMAASYGVSRATLREALRILEVQGLISLKPGPGGGPLVGTVEPRNLARTAALYFHLGAARYRDVMEAQVELESSCAQLAARHPDRAESMQPWLATAFPSEIDAYREVTVGFHTTIYQLCANPVLSLLTQSVTHIVSDHVVQTMDPVDLRPAIVAEHCEIAAAISAGDCTLAAELTASHFERQHAYLREHSPDRVDDYIEWR